MGSVVCVASVLFSLLLSFSSAQSPNGQLPHWATHGLAAKKQPHLLGAPLSTNSTQNWFKPPLDHFGKGNETIDVRYFVDETFWGDGSSGVMLFMMGGEGQARGIGQDFVYSLAKEHKALIAAIEHRFYGKSLPAPLPEGYSVENLQYLTVNQALADAAMLIEMLDAKYAVRNKTFTFGGSYSGALSAWFRTEYDTHTRGSLSSSGVVNAILEFPQFDDQIHAVISANCSATIQAATIAFENALRSGDRSAALEMFAIRNTDITDSDFMYMVADGVAMAVQYNHKLDLCSALEKVPPTSSNTTLMHAVAGFIRSYWGPDFGNTCFYDSACVANGTAERWQGGTDRCWRWQKCTELAYLQVSPLTNSLRSSLLDLPTLIAQCKDMFGNDVVPDTKPINEQFGADTPKGTNIFFSDFSDDPWLRASVRREINPSLPYSLVHCDGCGHCLDLKAPSPSDPLPLQQERARFAEYLRLWLK